MNSLRNEYSAVFRSRWPPRLIFDGKYYKSEQRYDCGLIISPAYRVQLIPSPSQTIYLESSTFIFLHPKTYTRTFCLSKHYCSHLFYHFKFSNGALFVCRLKLAAYMSKPSRSSHNQLYRLLAVFHSAIKPLPVRSLGDPFWGAERKKNS